MAVDVSALRKFQDLWGPVLESLPAVMDAVAKQADLDRALQKSKKDLEDAKKEVADAKAEAQRIRDKAAEEDASLIAKFNAAVASAEQRVKDAEEAAQKRIDDAAAKVSAVEQKLAQHQAAITAAEARSKAKLAEMQKEQDDLLQAHEAEIKSLEDRKAKAEKAIETLKSKLG